MFYACQIILVIDSGISEFFEWIPNESSVELYIDKNLLV